MTIAYFDCFSGISGDMTLGALVDAGVSIDTLCTELAKLNLPGYDIKSEKVKRAGIAATKVHVNIERNDLTKRYLSDILDIIEGSSLSSVVRTRSSQIFKRLAVAEAKIHATSPNMIHFHEVGGVDTIVDIVGSVIGIELLGITRILASAINVGSGIVQTVHGILPIPAPATAELLTGIPVYQSSAQLELATPTGAAIISTMGASFGVLPQMKIDRVAYGAGAHDIADRPNVLRLFIGEPVVEYVEDTSVVIETSIDDMNPQAYDYIVDKLLQQGAQDVYLTPIIMKKGRPAVLLSALTDLLHSHKILDSIFRESTTIGVRVREVGRKILNREIKEITTIYGKIRIKISKHGNEIVTVTPEYEDCRKAAENRNIPLKTVMEEARQQFNLLSKEGQRNS